MKNNEKQATPFLSIFSLLHNLNTQTVPYTVSKFQNEWTNTNDLK